MRVAVLLKGFLLLGVSAIVFSLPAYATGGMGVMPSITDEYPNSRSWFIFETDLNNSVQDSVTLFNHLNRTIILQVAALDGLATPTGGYTLVVNEAENKDIGSWIVLDTNEVRLGPLQSKKVGFTVTVPSDADVGSHPGGIAAWRIDDKDVESSSPITIVTRIAARVYLTVPGDIIKDLDVASIGYEVQDDEFIFTLNLGNNGNVQLYPEVDLEIKNIFGKTIVEKTEPLGLILKNGNTKPTVLLDKKLPLFGKYTANFHIRYGISLIEEQSTDEYIDMQYVFYTIPWLGVAIVLGVLILIFGLYVLWGLWLNYKRRNTKTIKHIIKSGETLTRVANKYSSDSKKIVKFNLMKWPYDLHNGDTLLIPIGTMTKAERLAVVNKKSPIKLESVIIDKGDTVKSVAIFAKTDVGEVIEINHLRWPYRLKEDRELLIPVVITKSDIKKPLSKKTHLSVDKVKKNPKK